MRVFTDFYLVGRVLGRGALSCVFKGRVGYLRTAVAIKRLDREDKESPKAFFRELMIANSLHNPNIVPLLGFCIDPEEGLFLVYKYVSGGSLEQHLHSEFWFGTYRGVTFNSGWFLENRSSFLQIGKGEVRFAQHFHGWRGTRSLSVWPRQ